jgi:tetratricopeptide (TPR) repeat protein
MKQFKLFVIIFFCVIIAFVSSFGQSKFIQLDLNGGISKPIGSFSQNFMFAGQGYHGGAGFDYFFKNFGIGISGGYFTNPSNASFKTFIEQKYLETPSSIDKNQNWNTKYIMAGPTYKLKFGRFEWDFYVRAGVSQLRVPDLIFSKMFFGQAYEIYHFRGTTQDYQFAWNGGSRLIFKINQWLGLQAQANYFSTKYVSDVAYSYSYRNVSDANRNGVMEDGEYFESEKLKSSGKTDLSVLNLNMGLIFQLGRSTYSKVKMMPDVTVPSVSATETIQPQTTNDVVTDQNEKAVPESEKVSIVGSEKSSEIAQTETKPKENKENVAQNEDIPIVNAAEEKSEQTDNQANDLEYVKVPATSFDAPEAKYDAEAAEFLYKAGESYFAMNDFENALPCFNKLKADPNYPRSKYMFALSLCAMGNCDEGKREYKEFAKSYKENDARTLEIIFASQFEKCATTNKNKARSATIAKDSSVNLGNGMEYKIQFIAIRKSDSQFPGVAKVGTVSTEYFPNKSVYRYTLNGYQQVSDAVRDLTKVRKMGFRDAFIAVYQNGVRVNTIYHKR